MGVWPHLVSATRKNYLSSSRLRLEARIAWDRTKMQDQARHPLNNLNIGQWQTSLLHNWPIRGQGMVPDFAPGPGYWSVWPPCSDWGSPSSTAWCLMSTDRGHSPASIGTPGLAWQQRTMFVCGLVVVFSRLYGYEWWCLRQLGALIIIKSKILLRQINRPSVWKRGQWGCKTNDLASGWCRAASVYALHFVRTSAL